MAEIDRVLWSHFDDADCCDRGWRLVETMRGTLKIIAPPRYYSGDDKVALDNFHRDIEAGHPLALKALQYIVRDMAARHAR